MGLKLLKKVKKKKKKLHSESYKTLVRKKPKMKERVLEIYHSFVLTSAAYILKIGMKQRRLAWPLPKDDTKICEVFHIFLKNST